MTEEAPVVKEQPWSYANTLDFLSLFKWKIKFDEHERAYKLPEPLIPDKFCPMIEKEIPSVYCLDCSAYSASRQRRELGTAGGSRTEPECRYLHRKPQHTVSCVFCGRKTASKRGICQKCKVSSYEYKAALGSGGAIEPEATPEELFIQLTEVPIVQLIAPLEFPLQEVVRNAILNLINTTDPPLAAGGTVVWTPSEIAKNENIIRLIKESRAASNQKDEGRQIIYVREINRRCNQLLKQGLIQDVSGRMDVTVMGKFVKVSFRQSSSKARCSRTR